MSSGLYQKGRETVVKNYSKVYYVLVLKYNYIQGLYSVRISWKSMEFNIPFFKVINSMKFRVAVWKSMDFREYCGDFFR